MREAFLNELRRLMGDVEKYTWRAGAFDLGVDCARNDIPRRQLRPCIVSFHEGFAAIIPQNSALTSHRFGN